MQLEFRPARAGDAAALWAILRGAIARRARDGSDQWQNGYPNPDVVAADIAAGAAHVLVDAAGAVVACATVVDDEPSYAVIRGRWLTDGPYVAVHRVAVAEAWLGKGLAQTMLAHLEALARARGVASVRVDTKHDNPAMLRVFDKRGFVSCGEILVGGSPRRAYEKPLG